MALNSLSGLCTLTQMLEKRTFDPNFRSKEEEKKLEEVFSVQQKLGKKYFLQSIPDDFAATDKRVNLLFSIHFAPRLSLTENVRLKRVWQILFHSIIN